MWVNRQVDHDIAGDVLASLLESDCRASQNEGNRDEMSLVSIVDWCCRNVEC